MTNAITYCKVKLSKWVLIATIFLSVFAFSGYTGNPQARQQKTIPTELVFCQKSKTPKHTYLFIKAVTSTLNYKVSKQIKEYESVFLYAYNRLAKVKYDNLSAKAFLFWPAYRFTQVKTIPRSSNEDIFFSNLRG
jgi:hypothetical protein